MGRDSIFYKLFQQYPNLLFTLLTNPPENSEEYRFDSVAVKEPKLKSMGYFSHRKAKILGELPEDVRQGVEILPLEELENLGEGLLDFSSMADLQAWLEEKTHN